MRTLRTDRAGFALLTVILVLAALLMLLTPFLVSARNTDQGSAQLYDRALTRTAIDTARLHARAELERSHFALDETAYSDSLEELTVTNRFPDGFLNAGDHQGVMWDVEATDLAGLIDLSSAPPQLLSNLMGTTTRFTRPVEPDDDRLPIAGAGALPPQGVVFVGGEFIHYGGIEDNELVDLERGLGSAVDEDGRALPGPRPPSKHGVGAPLIDQRSLAPVQWRMDIGAGDLRPFTTPEQLELVDDLVVAGGGLGPDGREALLRTTTVHGGIGAGSVWQRPLRLTAPLAAGESDRLTVDVDRYVNEGATVRIRDGEVSEIFLVVRVSRSGILYLDRAVDNDYPAYEAVVEVLARRPVNVNTAPLDVLEAVFTNLQIRGRNTRVTKNEARELAVLVAQMRPFGDLEDFLRWVVLPAAGIEALPGDAPTQPDALAGDAAIIDEYDALAIYTNALNANDALLSFSTVPFSLRSRDVYRTDLRAMVNAQSGVARHAEVREEVAVMVPQEKLLHLWHRQSDFDDALRLGRNAAWWSTGPEATSQYDGPYSPPSRLWPAMGTYQGRVYVPGVAGEAPNTDEPVQVEHTFPADDGPEHWAQLWPTRQDEEGPRAGRVMHFDREVRDLEGRPLLDEIVSIDPSDPMLSWVNSEGLMRQLSFSMWVKPRSHADGQLLDLGGSSDETDRVTLAFEQGDLVLRVIPAGGDHGGTTEEDQGEVRYSLGGGEGPGLPLDTWSHVYVDVRGCSPNQMTLLVNGTMHGVRTPGLTRLTSSVSESTTFLPVEDTDGFPQRGVARVGNELVEYVLATGGLDCSFNATGANAGFGGRNARVQWDDADPRVPTNLATVDMSHPAGTPVEHYGYSSIAISDIPSGEASLPDELGPFRVACVKGVEGAQGHTGDPILMQFQLLDGTTVDVPIGNGLRGANSTATGLVLGPAEDPEQGAEGAGTMAAFDKNGGYAAIIQASFRPDVDGSRVGGIEIVRYSGWEDDVLHLAERAVATPNSESTGEHSFVVEWVWVDGASQLEYQTQLNLRTFVVPISVPVPGASAVRGFLQGAVDDPRFAQLTRLDQPELTEWIAYNWFDEQGGFLVRDDQGVLNSVQAALVLGGAPEIDEDDPPVVPGSGFGGSGGGGTGSTAIGDGDDDALVGDVLDSTADTGAGDDKGRDTSALDADSGTADTPETTPVTVPFDEGRALTAGDSTTDPVDPEDGKTNVDPSVGPTGAQSTSGSYWEPFLGVADDASMPITRTVRSILQHRGVFGTAPQSHPSGTTIVPVFAVAHSPANGFAFGSPGRFDQVFVFAGDYQHLGWPVEVHRGHIPSLQVPSYSWQQANPDTPIASDGGTTTAIPNDTPLAVPAGFGCFVALVEPQVEPMPAGPVGGFGSSSGTNDARGLTRLAKFPSGERGRLAANATIGGGFRPGSGVVPEVVVDELLFHDDEFGTGFGLNTPDEGHGAQLVLDESFGESELRMRVLSTGIRLPLGDIGTGGVRVLGFLPQDAGLLRVGDEIVAYDAVDATTGEITLAFGGRGLLGTQPQPHGSGEPVTFLEGFTVTTLSGAISGDDGQIPLEDTTNFPNEGTLLIDDELVHYTRIRGGGVEMPRRASEPGAMDNEGSGIFRGRFGTAPAGHVAGAPAILFPVRYWDRWAERADAPEMAYFEFELAQPSAWWTGMFFEAEDAAMPGAELYVLQRSDPDVPWDADPESTDGLDLFRVGIEEGRELPLGFQADLVQWRVFVNYPVGAFDPLTGESHSWRTTPRLRRIGAFYYAPTLQLRSVER